MVHSLLYQQQMSTSKNHTLTPSEVFRGSAGSFQGPVPVPKDDRPLRVVITGATRGIGFELVRQYASAKIQHKIFAAVRNTKAENLVALQKEFPDRIIIVGLDNTKDDTIISGAKAVEKHTDAIDLLINNSAIMGESLLVTDDTRQNFNAVLDANVTGTLKVTQAFLPLLKKASATGPQSKVVFVGSALGSLNGMPSLLPHMQSVFGFVSTAYNISKTALNGVNIHFAAAVPDVTFFTIHPGWVRTDMGSQKAAIDVKDSVQSVRYVIESKSKTDTGAFFDVISGGQALPS
jgi:NAD(P)-dependent dehydrogenase (short-subunit alcohol dehydrogenase family)